MRVRRAKNSKVPSKAEGFLLGFFSSCVNQQPGASTLFSTVSKELLCDFNDLDAILDF